MLILWSRTRETSHVVCATECQLDTCRHIYSEEQTLWYPVQITVEAMFKLDSLCWSYVHSAVPIWLSPKQSTVPESLISQTQTPTEMSLPFASALFHGMKCSPLEPQNLAPMPLAKVQLQATMSLCHFTANITHASMNGWKLSPAHSNCKPKQRSTQPPHATFKTSTLLCKWVCKSKWAFSLWYFFENRNTLKLEGFVARSPSTSPSRKNYKVNWSILTDSK